MIYYCTLDMFYIQNALVIISKAVNNIAKRRQIVCCSRWMSNLKSHIICNHIFSITTFMHLDCFLCISDIYYIWSFCSSGTRPTSCYMTFNDNLSILLIILENRQSYEILMKARVANFNTYFERYFNNLINAISIVIVFVSIIIICIIALHKSPCFI